MDTKKQMFRMKATMNVNFTAKSSQKLRIDELSNGDKTKRKKFNKKLKKAFDIINKKILEMLIPFLLPILKSLIWVWID